MMQMYNLKFKQQGFVLIIVLLFLLVIGTLFFSMAGTTAMQYRQIAAYVRQEEVRQALENTLQHAATRLKQDKSIRYAPLTLNVYDTALWDQYAYVVKQDDIVIEYAYQIIHAEDNVRLCRIYLRGKAYPDAMLSARAWCLLQQEQ